MLYSCTGSAMTPDTAGPITQPRVMAVARTDKPKAWLLSSEDSETTAFIVATQPVHK